MATFNEYINDILETVRNNYIVDDTELTEALIAFTINYQRALWIRQEYNKPGRTIDHNIVQDLGCVELEEADRADCCGITIDCPILRTKQVIPNTIEFYNSTGITRVGPPDKLQIPISFVDYNQAVYSGNGKYNRNMLFAFLLNNRMYLITNSK